MLVRISGSSEAGAAVRYVTISVTRAPAARRASGKRSSARSLLGSRILRSPIAPHNSRASASPLWFVGIVSTRNPSLEAASAVVFPIAAINGRGVCKAATFNSSSRIRRQKNRTAFLLVKRIQSNSGRRSSSASRARESCTAEKLTVGSKTTSAPSALRECASSCAWSVARVTTTRFPAKGFLIASNRTPRAAQNLVYARFNQDLAEPHPESFGIVRVAAQFFAHKFFSVGRIDAGFQSQFAVLMPRPGAKRNLTPSLQFTQQSSLARHGGVAFGIVKPSDEL